MRTRRLQHTAHADRVYVPPRHAAPLTPYLLLVGHGGWILLPPATGCPYDPYTLPIIEHDLA